MRRAAYADAAVPALNRRSIQPTDAANTAPAAPAAPGLPAVPAPWEVQDDLELFDGSITEAASLDWGSELTDTLEGFEDGDDTASIGSGFTGTATAV
jgi:hypothetical protein